LGVFILSDVKNLTKDHKLVKKKSLKESSLQESISAPMKFELKLHLNEDRPSELQDFTENARKLQSKKDEEEKSSQQ